MGFVIVLYVTMMAGEPKFGYIGQPLPTMEICDSFRTEHPAVLEVIKGVASEDGVESVKSECMSVKDYNDKFQAGQQS